MRAAVLLLLMALAMTGSAAAQERLIYQDGNVEAVVERAGEGVGKSVILDITFTNKTPKTLRRASVTVRFYDDRNRLVREATVPMIALDAAVAKTKYTAPAHTRLELGPVTYEFTQ